MVFWQLVVICLLKDYYWHINLVFFLGLNLMNPFYGSDTRIIRQVVLATAA